MLPQVVFLMYEECWHLEELKDTVTCVHWGGTKTLPQGCTLISLTGKNMTRTRGMGSTGSMICLRWIHHHNDVQVCNSVAFSVFKMCNHHPLSSSRILPSSSKETVYLPIPSSCHALEATNLLSASTNVPLLNISYIWNLTKCGFLYLASVT